MMTHWRSPEARLIDWNEFAPENLGQGAQLKQAEAQPLSRAKRIPLRQLKLVHGNTQMGLGNRGCGQRPGGFRVFRRIGEGWRFTTVFRCSGPASVLGSQARCASICLSEEAAVLGCFATTHAMLYHTLLGWNLKLQRPRHIRR